MLPFVYFLKSCLAWLVILGPASRLLAYSWALSLQHIDACLLSMGSKEPILHYS